MIISFFISQEEGGAKTGTPVRLVETATFANRRQIEQKLNLPITEEF
jgi:hypothetical protein